MESIKVALRVRPFNKREIQKSEENIWCYGKDQTIHVQPQITKEFLSSKKLSTGTRTSFTFDNIYSPQVDNQIIYNTSVKQIALSSLEGINGTIFMYGQTGGGKTFTMLGNEYKLNDEEQKQQDMIVSKNNKIKLNKKLGSHFFLDVDYSSDEDNIIMIPDRQIKQNSGILILSLRNIFQFIENDPDKIYFIKCSYFEIYNDQIYDLLTSDDRLWESLGVGEDTIRKDFYIKGLVEEPISSLEDAMKFLKKGEINRHYASTSMNFSSSRSHTIFRLNVQTITNTKIKNLRKNKNQLNINNQSLFDAIFAEDENNNENSGSIVTEAHLNFVDLAGSEKIASHSINIEDGYNSSNSKSIENNMFHTRGLDSSLKIRERVKEGQSINKSLFFLTQVISLKGEGKPNSFIPYRNSPLTKILRSSLGGNSRTLIILCATSALTQIEQTMSTIRFGLNAKKIENKVQANVIKSSDSEALKQLLAEYEKKLKLLENESQKQTNQLNNEIEILKQQNKQLTQQLENKGTSIPLVLSMQQSQNGTLLEHTLHLKNVGDISCQLTKYSLQKGEQINIKKPEDIISQQCLENIFIGLSKVYKLESKIREQKQLQFEDNFAKFNEKYKNIIEERLTINYSLIKLYQFITQFFEDYNDLQIKYEEINKKLLFSEKNEVIQDINTEEIDKLENFFSQVLDNIKHEKKRRQQQAQEVREKQSMSKLIKQNEQKKQNTYRNIEQQKQPLKQTENISTATHTTNISQDQLKEESVIKEQAIKKILLNILQYQNFSHFINTDENDFEYQFDKQKETLLFEEEVECIKQLYYNTDKYDERLKEVYQKIKELEFKLPKKITQGTSTEDLPIPNKPKGINNMTKNLEISIKNESISRQILIPKSPKTPKILATMLSLREHRTISARSSHQNSQLRSFSKSPGNSIRLSSNNHQRGNSSDKNALNKKKIPNQKDLTLLFDQQKLKQKSPIKFNIYESLGIGKKPIVQLNKMSPRKEQQQFEKIYDDIKNQSKQQQQQNVELKKQDLPTPTVKKIQKQEQQQQPVIKFQELNEPQTKISRQDTQDLIEESNKVLKAFQNGELTLAEFLDLSHEFFEMKPKKNQENNGKKPMKTQKKKNLNSNEKASMSPVKQALYSGMKKQTNTLDELIRQSEMRRQQQKSYDTLTLSNSISNLHNVEPISDFHQKLPKQHLQLGSVDSHNQQQNLSVCSQISNVNLSESILNNHTYKDEIDLENSIDKQI